MLRFLFWVFLIVGAIGGWVVILCAAKEAWADTVIEEITDAKLSKLREQTRIKNASDK